MPDAVLDAEETAGVKVDRIFSFMELTFEKASKTQTTKYIITLIKYMLVIYNEEKESKIKE